MYYIIAYIYCGTLKLSNSQVDSTCSIAGARLLPASCCLFPVSRRHLACTLALALACFQYKHNVISLALALALPSAFIAVHVHVHVHVAIAIAAINVTQAIRAASLPPSLHMHRARPYCQRSIPAILLDHVCQLNDKFAFLVFLTGLVGMFIFPAQRRLAALAINICDCMQSS